MTVIQAIELSIMIYTLRTLRGDEAAGYIALVRTSNRIPDFSVRDTEGDDLRSAGIAMDGDDYFQCRLSAVSLPLSCQGPSRGPAPWCFAPSPAAVDSESLLSWTLSCGGPCQCSESHHVTLFPVSSGQSQARVSSCHSAIGSNNLGQMRAASVTPDYHRHSIANGGGRVPVLAEATVHPRGP